MHLLAEHVVSIRRPVAAAYAYATNLERFGDWFPGVLAIRSANDRPHGEVGKAYLELVRIPLLGRREVPLTVKDARTDEFFATEGRMAPLLPRMEMRFQAIDAQSCRVAWRMLSRNSGVLARMTVLPLARRVLAKRSAAGLAALKRRLEASDGAS